MQAGVDTPRVVITGTGVVSPIGTGNEAFWRSLMQGRSGVNTRDSCVRMRTAQQLRVEHPWQKKIVCVNRFALNLAMRVKLGPELPDRLEGLCLRHGAPPLQS